MSKSRKAGVVDSYAAIKAVERAAVARGQPVSTGAPEPPASAPPPDLKQLGAHVAHTALPPKQHIECYECGYKFQLHGRAATTHCSKCKVVLDLTDHVIDTRWTRSFKTCGIIRIAASGIVESGELIARDIILEGTLESGTLRALGKLELCEGARFSELNIQSRDLVIAPGATIAFMEPAEYRNVEISGALRANLRATGLVTVRAGGSLEGELHGEHLSVEDGGGLLAVVQITHQ